MDASNTDKTLFTVVDKKYGFSAATPDNMQQLRAALEKVPSFKDPAIFYLSAEGNFVHLNSDEELQKASSSSKHMMLFLAKDCDRGLRRLEARFFARWFKKVGYRSLLMPSIVTLRNAGYKPKVIKNNLSLLLEHAGDAEGTHAAFLAAFPPQQKQTKQKKEKRGKKRKEGHQNNNKEVKEEKLRKKKAKIADPNSDTPRQAFVGQSHDLEKEFRELAIQAYDADLPEKLLAGKFRKLIIDGNNLLYITSALRNFTLHHNIIKAQKMISCGGFLLSQLVGIDTEVLFDTTTLPSSNRFRLETNPPEFQIHSCTSLDQISVEIAKFMRSFPLVGVPLKTSQCVFTIASAKPHFNTSDDKMIAMAKLNASSPMEISSTNSSEIDARNLPVKNGETIVVSSDRALVGELCHLGVSCMKPTQFIGVMQDLVNKLAGIKMDEEKEKAEDKEKEEKEKKKEIFKWFDDMFVPSEDDQ